MDQQAANKIRTIWFLFAMIPVVFFVGLLGLVSLVLMSPLMIYAKICGKHLKDPFRRKPLIAD
ncbi:MAG TPA: hypothetical protein VK463_15925 [Desulfomonilaceae bacterium]|nr:hypothetical protein [Desulfomonilaceae bacterium]